MDAEDLYLQDLYTGKDQFIVPVFQRRYSWRKKHWEQLWADVVTLLDSPLGEDEHFIGAFVSMSSGNRPGARPKYLVIDGQQRLITITLLLSAIRDRVDSLDEETLDSLPPEESNNLKNLSDKIQDENLVDPYEEGNEKYRIISRTEDREALFDILDQKRPPDDTAITDAYTYFCESLDDLVDRRDPFVLHDLRQTIIEQLPLAMITAEEDENPYTIFETLNERGLDLQESDLIRNYVFMQLDLEEQDEFNEENWLPFERKFTEPEEYPSLSLTRFYRNYLMRDGEYVKQNSVYDAFKDRVEKGPRELIGELNYYSDIYLKIRRPQTAAEEWLRKSLSRRKKLDIGTADPLYLNLIDRWKSGELDRDELQRIFEGLESFAIRRSICDYSTRGYYQIFPSATKSIDGDQVAKSLFDYLANRGWPDDDEFRDAFVTFDLYSREKDKCRLIFETLQRDYGHKEPVELEELQLEHVMPQSIGEDEHGRAWREMLGDDWEELHSRWKHTPGNLTLTGYNPELSNNRFSDKQELFADSKLDLNEYFVEVDQWTVLEIRDRGEALARRVAELWPVPAEVTDHSETSGTVRASLLEDGIPVAEFEHTVRGELMRDVVAYLIEERELLESITLPYIPGTGEGDRALLNRLPEHPDGSEMSSGMEISGGLYLSTELDSGEKQRHMRELARHSGLVCRFDGDWPRK